jgi:hypothetical protein
VLSVKLVNKRLLKGEKIMNFWEKVKGDLQKGIKDGIDFVKEGAAIVKVKAEELTEEGKKRLNILELKAKVQREIAELGGMVYDLSSRVKNPMLEKKVKAVVVRVRKLELQVKAATRKRSGKQTAK